jgi:uncharacterized membrane protein YedE/YeeE
MFPLGIESYLIGGVIIGVAVSLVYLLTGLHATQSSFFTTTLSWFSKRKHFQKDSNLKERNWRLTLAIGLVMGALLYTLTLSTDGFYTTTVQLWRLVLGGLLVGFGTRLSSGCTSGHGISGIASLSMTSLYAVAVFMGIAVMTANLIQIIGVAP